MTQFIADLARFSSLIAASVALVLSALIVGSVTILSLPLLLILAPTLITALCLYATYQYIYPHVPATIVADDEWKEVQSWPITMEEYHRIMDYPLAIAIPFAIPMADESDEIQDSITSHYPSPCDDLEPGCSDLSSPVLPTMDTEEETPSITESKPTLRSSCNLDHYSHDALVSLAKELKIKGVNGRWTDATLIRKIEERTLMVSSAA